ncbi:MAG: PEGA domain-containing protein [Myxococcaceae bacterium]
MAFLSVASVAAPSQALLAADRCSDGSAAPVVAALRDALLRMPGLQVQNEAATTEALGGLPHGSMDDVEQLIANSRFEIYDRVAYDAAQRTLVPALDKLWRLAPTDGRWKRLGDVQVLLAFVELKRGRKLDSERILERFFRAHPDHRVDPIEFAPSFRAFADAVRNRVKKSALLTLSVTSQPAGLPVFLEGRPIGKAPQTISLPAGDYVVEVAFGDHRGVPRKVILEAGRSTAVELRGGFEGAVYADKGPCLVTENQREARLASLAQMATLLGVKELVTVRIEDSAGGERHYIATLFDATNGTEPREARVRAYSAGLPAGAIEGLATFLTTGEARAPVESMSGGKAATSADSSSPVAVVAPPQPPASSLRTGAWITGGAGLGVLAASAFFLVQANDLDGRLGKLCPNKVCPTDASEPAYEELVTARGSSRTTGAVLGGVAAAAIATGAVLFILSGEASPPSSSAFHVEPAGGGLLVRF